MSNPKVSIITRTRNRDLFLRRAAQSVLGQQDAPAWEWIVVNDGGERQNVEAALAEAQRQHPSRIRILHLSRSNGMEHASNRGIELASGQFLSIHDDDDSWAPAFMREMVAWLEDPANGKFAGVVCHSLRVEEVVEEDRLITKDEAPFNTWLKELDPWTILEENPFPPISFLFRRAAYDEVGPFDESLPVLGDWEFNVRLILRGPIGVLPKVLAHYHHRPRRTTGPSANSITAGHHTHRHWEEALRSKWKESSPFSALPQFGLLAAAAGPIKASRDRLDRLFSLPIRPGP